MYLDQAYLARRTNLRPCRAKLLPNHFAMYSPQFIAGRKLTPDVIKRIYEKEVIDISRPNTFMGIWQLFAMAFVLQCQLYCVYPKLGNPGVRADLNRMILPRVANTCEDVYIMWTTTRQDMTAVHWVVNHCVPLFRVSENVAESEDTHDADLVHCSFSEDEVDLTHRIYVMY